MITDTCPDCHTEYPHHITTCPQVSNYKRKSMTTIERLVYHRDLMRRVRASAPPPDPDFGVTRRVVDPWEPAWVVFRNKGGSEGVALFYDQDDAQRYADWRNEQNGSSKPL